MATRNQRRSAPAVSFRRETLIFMPTLLFLVGGLSTFTLLAYRSAIAGFADQLETTARASAERLAADLARGVEPRQALDRATETALSAALIERDGRTVLRAGRRPGAPMPLPPDASRALESSIVVRRYDPTNSLLAYSPLADPDAPGRWLRLEVDASLLAVQERALRVLVPLVLLVNLAAAALLVFYLRHLLRPIDQLLARARQVAGYQPTGEDDVERLLADFDRALVSLQRRTGGSDEVAALQSAIGASLSSGALLLDRSGTVLALNRTGEEILALEPGSWRGRSHTEALKRHPELIEALTSTLAGGPPIKRSEIELGAANGRTLGVTVSPLHNDEGTTRGYLALFTDLTEAKRHAREAQISESLGHFAELTAGLAHELRNGLATLQGYLSLVEPSEHPERLREYLGELRQETDHLHRVVEDFLDFARPGSARMTLVPVERLAHRAAADPALAGAAVRVTADDRARDAAVHGDELLLERALRNLLHNAARAQRRAGVTTPIDLRVELGLAPSERPTVRFLIEDRGPGIDPDMRDRLFVPFVSSGEGVGLGLALSRRIAELHEASLSLDDRAGGGVRATLEIPGQPVTKRNDGPGGVGSEPKSPQPPEQPDGTT